MIFTCLRLLLALLCFLLVPFPPLVVILVMNVKKLYAKEVYQIVNDP